MSDARSLTWPGVPLALVSALLFGASTPLAKLLLDRIDPWLLAGLLYLGAGGGLWLMRRLGRLFGWTKASEAPLGRSDVPWLVGVVVAGGIVGPLLLVFGLARVEASSASLLLNLEGLATMALAWIVFRENVDRRIMTGALSILAGAALLGEGGVAQFGLGEAMVAGACIAWGVENNLTRKLSAADPVTIATIKGLSAGSVNLIAGLALGAALPPPEVLPPAMAVGFLGYGVSVVLFVLALRHLGAARTSAYFSLAPFVGVVLSVLFLDETVTLRLIGAGALMAFGLYLHLTERHRHEHMHEPLEHEHRHVHDEHHRHEHEDGVATAEPHVHRHRHERLRHSHAHYPDIHHRHGHGKDREQDAPD